MFFSGSLGGCALTFAVLWRVVETETVESSARAAVADYYVVEIYSVFGGKAEDREILSVVLSYKTIVVLAFRNMPSILVIRSGSEY